MLLRPGLPSRRRAGVVLLVVITLLTLFAVVGIAFVMFAQAEATAARVWRESETLQQPDMDPEMLLAYFLSQFVYGTNNPYSALQYQDLATNMYGAVGNTVPFNGTGRIHTAANPANDDYYKIDYTQYPAGTAGINPRTYIPGTAFSPNAPYTYPDFNNVYLAAVRAADGTVLVPSFVKYYTPQAGAPVTVSLRPSAAYHGNTWSMDFDGVADVKNLPDSPGVLNPATGQLTGNDSVWLDLGFPVMKAPDGRKFKPLFAALVQDLDNRLNVNTSGNILAANGGSISHQGWGTGEMNPGLILTGATAAGPESANLFGGSPLWSPAPPTGSNGRYDPAVWPTRTEILAGTYAPGGHFYNSTNLACATSATPPLTLPAAGTNFGFPYLAQAYTHGWLMPAQSSVSHPALYNYFANYTPSSPALNSYQNGAPPAQTLKNQWFRPGNMEALLRYADKGSPALTSQLFRLCPQSFATAKARRLVTTQSFDSSRPGVMPCVYTPGNYQLAAGANPPFPTLQPVPFQFPAPALPAGEFGTAMGAISPGFQTLLKRIDLNRGFPDDYPALNSATAASNPYQIDPSQYQAYQKALGDRQQMATEIFNILLAVTGTAPVGSVQPDSPTAPSPTYAAQRALAQLAVNIVDYLNFSKPNATPAPDDIMTAFNWNTQQTGNINNGWVFGTVLPRLVINEAFVQVSNVPQTQGVANNNMMNATNYDINAWVELHNPFASDSSTATPAGQVNANPAIATPLGGVARLYFPGSVPATTAPSATTPNGYAGYRLIVTQTQPDDLSADPNYGTTTAYQGKNANALTAFWNVLGVPLTSKNYTLLDLYAPDSNTNVTYSDTLNQVLPNFQGNGTAAGSMQAGTYGGNSGFYVLAPGTPTAGTPSSRTTPSGPPNFGMAKSPFNGTLPVKEQAAQTAADPTLVLPMLTAPATLKSSMHYVFTPTTPANWTGNNFVQNLQHTIVLQRLACPYLPYQPNPNAAAGSTPFNPYVTVDCMLQAPIYDNVTTDGAGKHMAPAQNPYASYGRNQPYAADQSQQVQQQNPTTAPGTTPPATAPPMNSPANTFATYNCQTQPQAYDWLVHMNRPLVSPIELLQVSGYKPAQLTQLFYTSAGKFQHRAPWLQTTNGSSTMIYRAFEFFEAGLRPQWTPIGGRFPGKININTIWDPDTFQAMCDAQPTNFFTAQAVTSIYQAMTSSRTPNASGVPGGGADRPFLGMAAPFAPVCQQYPNAGPSGFGVSIDDTILRPDPAVVPQQQQPPTATFDPLKRLLQPNPNSAQGQLVAQAGDQPYLRMELLNKIFNNVTTRSNVFAVWLTVGFFEVNDNNGTANPPLLLREIGRSENRQVRHRMFAIIDRSNLAIAANSTPPSPANTRPFYINSLTAVSANPGGGAPGTTTISVPALSGNYEEATWNIQPNTQLVIDSGPNQEIVIVPAGGVNAAQLQFTATFQYPHPIGFAISGSSAPAPLPGNPGPAANWTKPNFDPRNPNQQGVIRFFNIID